MERNKVPLRIPYREIISYELCIDASVGEEAAADVICSYITRMAL